jgi:hypothetical protein
MRRGNVFRASGKLTPSRLCGLIGRRGGRWEDALTREVGEERGPTCRIFVAMPLGTWSAVKGAGHARCTSGASPGISEGLEPKLEVATYVLHDGGAHHDEAVHLRSYLGLWEYKSAIIVALVAIVSVLLFFLKPTKDSANPRARCRSSTTS